MNEDKLLKTEESNARKVAKNKSNSDSNINKNYMRQICNSLSDDDYDPQKTVEIIQDYLEYDKDSMRLMYSELSNHLFSIFKNEKYESDYNFNIDKLYNYAMNDANMCGDCRKIIIKLFDHSSLVSYQITGIEKIAEEISEKVAEKNKETLMDSMKDSEKQYITILGIFASIVLAFTGGIAFSTSVLSNIDKASIYRLVFVTSLLGFMLFNTICVMFEFVREINNKSLNLTFKSILKKPLWLVPNMVFLVIMIISTLAYYCGSVQQRNINSKVSNNIHMEIKK
ncbi:hypothetical protein [Peptostreptococcus anaerobius]|uniref:hypothetical protein n=1 Tax=Peptostreptococcus anaerobius TaxID=1261 RepID=UPI0034A24237